MRENFKIYVDSKCYGASKYLENLNKDQSYRSVKIEKSRRVLGPLEVAYHGIITALHLGVALSNYVRCVWTLKRGRFCHSSLSRIICKLFVWRMQEINHYVWKATIWQKIQVLEFARKASFQTFENFKAALISYTPCSSNPTTRTCNLV
jgi:hypothetical protein